MSKTILLTGATGFVGKVVLAELLRLRNDLDIDRIILLIRPKRARGVIQTPEARFNEQLARSPAMATSESGWQRHVEVVGANLEAEHGGIEPAARQRLQGRVTHIIHCAASVDFDLPIQQAANANIVSALNVLELARGCSKLTGMVDVSTSYVQVWRKGPIGEAMANLPRPAAE
jgi:alcohol-forming fatty acyl-CoA reductase